MHVAFSQGFEARGTELSDKTVTFMKLHETLKTYGGARYELKKNNVFFSTGIMEVIGKQFKKQGFFFMGRL